MNRVWPVAIAAAALGIFANQRFCAAEAVLALPLSADAWKLQGNQQCDKPVPPSLQLWRGTAGARSVCRAEYAGEPPVRLTLYYMPNQFASAFDAAQKWQPRPGKMSFFKGQYFGVAESAGAGPFVLERFVLAVEAALPPGDEWHH